MFVNFHVSVTVIVLLLAKSRAPKSSESGTIYLPLEQLLLLQRALFSEIFEFGKLFLILQNVCDFSRFSYCNCITISQVEGTEHGPEHGSVSASGLPSAGAAR